MARARGISKAQGYLSRVFCIEYDLAGAINAYGLEFTHWLLDEIAAGRVNTKQDVERWAAHVHLTQDYTFTDVRANYGGEPWEYPNVVTDKQEDQAEAA